MKCIIQGTYEHLVDAGGGEGAPARPPIAHTEFLLHCKSHTYCTPSNLSTYLGVSQSILAESGDLGFGTKHALMA